MPKIRPAKSTPLAQHVGRVLMSGTLASLASAAVLAWRGRVENASAAAPLNAPAHWFFGRESLHRDDGSLRHTATGLLVHHASSVFWAGFYEWLQSRRRRVTPAAALSDAAVVTCMAAVVDLKVVPERLTPGFERRLGRLGLAGVYAGFAVGLALAGLLRAR
jgi:hypothetical protein